MPNTKKQWLVVLILGVAFAASSESPLFHAPFDGTVDAVAGEVTSQGRIYGDIEFVDGIKGEAVVVGGKKERVIFNAEQCLDMETGTCSFWVSPQNWVPSTRDFAFFVSFQALKNKSTSDIIIYKLCKSTNLALFVRNRGTKKSNSLKKNVALWQKEKWHNIVITWDGKWIKLYLDGNKSGKMPRFKLPAKWNKIVVGAPYPAWGFIGNEKSAIDELFILKNCLSAKKVKTHYKKMIVDCAKRQSKNGDKLEVPLLFHASFDKTPTPDKASSPRVRTYGSNIAITPGIKGSAGTVAGKDKIKIYYDGNKNVDSEKGTCAIWIKPDWYAQSKKCYFIVSLFGSGGRILLLKPHNAAKMSLIIQNSKTKKNALISKSIADWNPGQWHQIAFSWDAGLYRLYVDGTLCGKAKLHIADNKWSNLVLGTSLPSWANVGEKNTFVDEFKIFSEPLSRKRVKKDFDSYVSANNSMRNLINRKKKMKTFRNINDLALAKNGAWILASSFENYNDCYPDNLIDNDSATIWRAKETTTPQYLELRWKFPRKIDKITFRYASKSIIQAASIAVFDRVTGNWKNIKKASIDELKKGEITFPVTTCDQIRLQIEKMSDATSLSELEAYGPPQSIVGKHSPYWDAWYIWYPEPDQVHKASQPRYFRRVFNLNDSSWFSAFIQARSNDYYRIWFNGVEIGTGSTNISPINVTKHLKMGKNIIAVESNLRRNPGRWGWGELLVELSVNYNNYSKRVGTGSEWKCFDKKNNGWNQLQFDDSQWLPPYRYKRPPNGPWGKIPYYCTSVSEKIKVAEVKTTPKIPQRGHKVRVTVKLSPTTSLKRDYFFAFELGKKYTNPHSGDCVISRSIVDTTSQKDESAPFIVTAEIPLPPWTPSGVIPLRLRGYDKKSGIEIELEGVEDNIIANIATPERKSSIVPIETSKVAYTNGQASFLVNKKCVTPFFWRHHALPNPKTLYEMDKYSNIKIHHFLLEGGIIDPNHGRWTEKMKEIDENIETLLAIDPEVSVIVQADLRPTMQWLQENPKERLLTAFGERDVVSFASKKYTQECRAFWKFLLDHLKQKPYWGRVLGFHVWACGLPDSVMGGTPNNTWQSDRSKITAGDFNPQALEMFRDFLRKKYKNNQSDLRKSWNNPNVTFKSATPTIKEMMAEGKNGNVFRDPKDGRMTFDYAEFLPTLLGGFLRDLSRFVKTETDWKKMIFVHYGFVIAHMQGYNSPGSQLNNNNYDLPDMLKDPSIDAYIGAPCYGFRLPGTPMVTYFPWSSIQLNNRMYLPDDDNRTYLSNTKNYGRNHGRQETKAIVKRNMGADITRNFGSWFSDLSQGSGRSGVSWTGEKEVVEMIAEMESIYKKAINIGYESAAEIAVVFSVETPRFQDVYYGPTLNNNMIKWMWYTEFFKLGAPFDVYMTSDLRNPKFNAKQYKLIVMMNTFYLSDADRAAVEALKNKNRAFLWFYAPGYIDWNKGLTTNGIESLTGMNTVELPGKEQMKAILSTKSHPLAAGLAADHHFNAGAFAYPATKKMHPAEFGPRFRISDEKATIIAKFADGGGAIAAREFKNWKSVYSVVPRLDAEFLRNICKWAGVHIYTDKSMVLDANRHFIVLHRGYTGFEKVQLSLPRECSVFDACTNSLLGEKTKKLTIELPPCSTKILLLR